MSESYGNKKVLVFREEILLPSETFIAMQTKRLHHYSFQFACLIIKEHSLIDRDSIVSFGLNAKNTFVNKLSKILYKLFSICPPKFIQRIKDFAPSLVHVHFTSDAFWFLPLSRFFKIPMLITVHGYDILVKEVRGSFLNLLYQKGLSKLFNNAKGFIAVSNFTKQKLIERGCPEDKIHVHYIGVDVDAFSRDETVKVVERIVLFTGRLVEKKGCEYLIDAMSIVQKQLPDSKLIIIGDGPLRESLMKRAEEKLVNCEFLGVQSPSSVKQWLNKARVFCGPSVVAKNGDAETFGIVFIEAQSMKVPVVSFRSGGIPEAVKHGVTGLLAQEKNIQELALNIVTLLSDDELWKRMSLDARNYVVENFNLAKQTAELEKIYDKISANNVVL